MRRIHARILQLTVRCQNGSAKARALERVVAVSRSRLALCAAFQPMVANLVRHLFQSASAHNKIVQLTVSWPVGDPGRRARARVGVASEVATAALLSPLRMVVLRVLLRLKSPIAISWRVRQHRRPRRQRPIQLTAL